MKPWCGTVAITRGGQTSSFWVYSPATPGEEHQHGPPQPHCAALGHAPPEGHLRVVH